MKTKIIPFGPIIILILSVFLWATSLKNIDPSKMTGLGLVSVLPVAFILSFLLLSAGFALLVTRFELDERLLLLYMVMFTVIIHGTPNIVYGTLRYPWAWKHVGVVDYIIRHGSVNPNIPVLQIYHSWPGFFSLNAFLTQVAGLDSPLEYAGWGPLFFNLLFVFTLVLLFRDLTPDRRVVWLGVWLFELGNWVGQDYFSPQAMAYFLYLLILGILLSRFSTARPFPFQAFSRPFLLRWLRPITSRLSRLSQTGRPTVDLTNPWRRATFAIIVLLLFGVIVATHQLTPMMGIVAVLTLAVFLYVRWWSLSLWMISMTLLWLMFPASTFFRGQLSSIFSTVGTVGSNVSNSLVDLSAIGTEQALVAVMARILTGVIAVLAVLGFIRRVRNGFLDLPAVLLAISPVAMILLNGYGGEILFRVYLFSLPFLAFLAACFFFANPARVTRAGTGLAIFGISLVLMVTFLFAYYGKELQNYARPKEVEAMQYLYSIARPRSLLVEGSHDYPVQFRNYEYFTYVPIDREPQKSIDNILKDPVGKLDEWMSDSKKYSASYLVITTSQKAFVDSIHSLPPGTLDRIIQELVQAKGFTVVYQNEDAIIFTHPN